MSEGMKKLIKDLSDGKNISLENIDALVNKYHLSLEERQLLETKDEDDLKQLGLKSVWIILIKMMKIGLLIMWNMCVLNNEHTTYKF